MAIIALAALRGPDQAAAARSWKSGILSDSPGGLPACRTPSGNSTRKLRVAQIQASSLSSLALLRITPNDVRLHYECIEHVAAHWIVDLSFHPTRIMLAD